MVHAKFNIMGHLVPKKDLVMVLAVIFRVYRHGHVTKTILQTYFRSSQGGSR